MDVSHSSHTDGDREEADAARQINGKRYTITTIDSEGEMSKQLNARTGTQESYIVGQGKKIKSLDVLCHVQGTIFGHMRFINECILY